MTTRRTLFRSGRGRIDSGVGAAGAGDGERLEGRAARVDQTLLVGACRHVRIRDGLARAADLVGLREARRALVRAARILGARDVEAGLPLEASLAARRVLDGREARARLVLNGRLAVELGEDAPVRRVL